ncbi:hypothetical protein [Lutibacter sp. HS1-25]|uniref:hypothetical protein n=1 Tax=Lutibacter sp. HS1-25 TaxID=2485000 RepID=UPI001013237B|nr:hypothetical protein [Lutibacter sp. HS1-25]
MIAYLNSRDLHDIENLTVFSFATNLELAISNFIRTFGFGVGLGGHETMYKYYFSLSEWDMYYMGINSNSAHSLTIRVISEMGIIGILIYFNLIKGTLKMKNFNFQIISFAALSHFIVKSIKLGGYLDYGTIFFLVIIVLLIQNDKKDRNLYI